MNQARLIVFLVFLFLTGAIFDLSAASESFIESIYKAERESVGCNSLTIAGEQGGGRVDKKAVAVYQPDIENRLMDDIFRLLNQAKSVTVVDLRLKQMPVIAKTAANISRSAGYIRVRTFKVGSKSVVSTASQKSQTAKAGLVIRTRATIASKPAKKQIEKSATQPKAATVARPVENEARKTDSPASLIARLSRMGFTIEGGTRSSGGRWDSEQLFYLIKLLEVLPPHFSKCTKKFKRVANFGGNRGVMGYVFAGQPDVHITDHGVLPTKFEETLVHEMAHCWMFDKENLKIKEAYCQTFWPDNKQPVAGKEPPTSRYGHSNVFEDFAEAVRYYWQDCQKMRLTHPQRWKFLNKYIFKGVSYAAAQKIASAESASLANASLSRNY